MKILPVILASVMLITGVLTGCSDGLQTFNKYGMFFQVSSRLKLEEYTVSAQDQKFQKGPASVEQGALVSTDQNFFLMWLNGAAPNPQEIKFYISTTPTFFSSTSSNFKARISGSQTTEKSGNFEITFADIQLTSSGGEATGITAVWYCQTSKRTMRLILIDKQAETEMRSLVQSFSCG
jgi:hypothetical protein